MVTTIFVYDAMGNLTSKTEPSPFSYVTRFEYESVFNQMTKMTDANGRVTTRQIDPANGNRLAETDPLLQTSRWTYDSHGNVLTETDKRLHATVHAYDAFGNRVETTDREGHIWKMTYDAVGNVVTPRFPGHITH
jgi:YD repeat-containing protein